MSSDDISAESRSASDLNNDGPPSNSITLVILDLFDDVLSSYQDLAEAFKAAEKYRISKLIRNDIGSMKMELFSLRPQANENDEFLLSWPNETMTPSIFWVLNLLVQHLLDSK